MPCVHLTGKPLPLTRKPLQLPPTHACTRVPHTSLPRIHMHASHTLTLAPHTHTLISHTHPLLSHTRIRASFPNPPHMICHKGHRQRQAAFTWCFQPPPLLRSPSTHTPQGSRSCVKCMTQAIPRQPKKCCGTTFTPHSKKGSEKEYEHPTRHAADTPCKSQSPHPGARVHAPL